jgi:hypothetical protein
MIKEEIYQINGRPIATLIKEQKPKKDLIKIHTQLMFLNRQELEDFITWLMIKQREMDF